MACASSAVEQAPDSIMRSAPEPRVPIAPREAKRSPGIVSRPEGEIAAESALQRDHALDGLHHLHPALHYRTRAVDECCCLLRDSDQGPDATLNQAVVTASTPKTSTPRPAPTLTTARIAAFIPGASPPEVRTAILATAGQEPSEYIASISAAKCSLTTLRLTLSVPVSSPSSIVNSRGRITNVLICSTRANRSFIRSTVV